jgi:hypothetical protein
MLILVGATACGVAFEERSGGGGGASSASTASGATSGGGNLAGGGGGNVKQCAVRGLVYDAFDDFDSVDNPSLPWTYGMITGDQFQTFTVFFSELGLNVWRSRIGDDPNLVKNVTGTPVDLGFAIIPSEDFLHIHPGPSNELSTLRWTALISGQYEVVVNTHPLNLGGTSTDVSLFHKDQMLDSGEIDTTNKLTFTHTVSVTTGDTIEVRVGWGIDNNYGSDSTAVEMTIAGICP